MLLIGGITDKSVGVFGGEDEAYRGGRGAKDWGGEEYRLMW